ncbi:MAG: hypothetical protein LKJ76_06025 [Lachnospiraceae bacterium]|jgi:hypothetical protein|nr:hypothetical protein [Lachnospiraceae bacterium]
MGVTQILVLAACAAVVGSIAYIVVKVRRASRMLFGTADILKGISQREQEEATTPKSVSGMTSLMLPKIHEDFPGFNWTEWKHRCENTVRGYLEAIEQQDTKSFTEASSELKRQADLQISDDRERKLHRHFDEITVYQTEITNYTKGEGLCTILVQSSVGYVCTIDGQEEPAVKDKREQHRFDIEIVYVQDLSKVGAHATSFGMNCRNCGAPITDLGAVRCPYCGEALEPVNIRVWHINKLTERA